MRGRRFGVADTFGWGGLAFVVLIGAVSSSFSGATIMFGLFVLVVAAVVLARGRVVWARLGSRAAGGAALGAALILITVGAVAAPPVTPVAGPGDDPARVTAVTASPSHTTPATTSPGTSATPTTTPTVTAAPTTPPSPLILPVRPTTAPTSATPESPATGTALAAVAKLTVKGRAPKTGYTRDQFGQSWFDTDRNGCDTRNDMLRRDLGGRQMKNACKVLAGTLAPDPYTATFIRFVYGGASEIDIDHVVALSDAWQKGAASWPPGKRLALANDPLNLLAVDASANRSKGDGDTATWLPPNKSYRCAYVARQVAVKGKYGLWVTAAERDAMTRVLSACPSMTLPGPGSAPVVAVLPSTRPQPVPARVQPAPSPVRPTPPAASVYYANCTAVRAAGADPISSGDPGYSRKLDRDGDGIACE